MTRQPSNKYDRYHAHVYFDETSVEKASLLCSQAGEIFGVQVGHRYTASEKAVQARKLATRVKYIGNWLGRTLVGVANLPRDCMQFDLLIPWLEENREGLSVLVHGLTGNDLEDHTEHASWLGTAVPLKLTDFDT